MNIIDGFVIGMRFRMDGPGEPDRESIYETVFHALPRSVSEGAYVYGGIDTYDRFSPEPAFICLVGHLNLTKTRRLYSHFADNPAILSCLTAFRPIIQSNHFERLESRDDLGIADAEGVLRGGTESYGSMRFSGPEGRERRKPTALIGIGSETESTFDRTRRLGRLFGSVFPGTPGKLLFASDCRKDLADLILAQAGGRYDGVPGDGGTVRIGILPDHTVLILGNEKPEDLKPEVEKKGFERICHPEEYREFRGGEDRIRKDLARALKPFGQVLVLGAADPDMDGPVLERIRAAAAAGGHPCWILRGSEAADWEIASPEGTETFRSGETDTAVRILLSRIGDERE